MDEVEENDPVTRIEERLEIAMQDLRKVSDDALAAHQKWRDLSKATEKATEVATQLGKALEALKRADEIEGELNA